MDNEFKAFEAKKYAVYEIFERASGEVVYVGCTTNSKSRASGHKKTGMLNADRDIRMVCEAFNSEDAKRFEQACISSAKSKGQAKLNKQKPYNPRTPKFTGEIHEHFSRIGAKGGRTVTPAKLASLARVREIRLQKIRNQNTVTAIGTAQA